MATISGAAKPYIARSAAQVSSTSGAWVQVIAPGTNVNGVYISHLVCTDPNNAAEWRAHTGTPASSADGVELGLVGGIIFAGVPNVYRFDVGAIIPPGQGVFCKSGARSTMYHQVL